MPVAQYPEWRSLPIANNAQLSNSRIKSRTTYIDMRPPPVPPNPKQNSLTTQQAFQICRSVAAAKKEIMSYPLFPQSCRARAPQSNPHRHNPASEKTLPTETKIHQFK